MYLSPEFLLIMLVSVGLGFITQGYINSTFRKWSKVPVSSGLSGADVARRVLDSNGLQSVSIGQVAGNLTDHYDPRAKHLALSQNVYEVPSVAAAGVAAHEAGHAVQDAQRYVFGEIRTALVPAVNIGSSMAGVLIFFGLVVKMSGLLWLGIIGYATAVLFQLVTLPVEFDASRRALASLESTGVMQPVQVAGARQVLTAAALTYVASALISVMYLLYYIGLARRD